MEEMTRMLKTLTLEITRLQLEGKQANRLAQEGGNRNKKQSRRPNKAPESFWRERRNNEDQGIQAPF